MQILQLFFDCDEFCRDFLPQLAAQQLDDGKPHRQRSSSLSTSEVMTIVILFHHSGFRNFKTYYTQQVCQQWRREFPQLVSDQRFVELKPSALIPLAAFLHSRFGNGSGISFIDATSIAICHNRRIRDSAKSCGKCFSAFLLKPALRACFHSGNGTLAHFSAPQNRNHFFSCFKSNCQIKCTPDFTVRNRFAASVRNRTAANGLSMTLLVRKCRQCSLGYS
jgi:hypothetical protein